MSTNLLFPYFLHLSTFTQGEQTDIWTLRLEKGKKWDEIKRETKMLMAIESYFI